MKNMPAQPTATLPHRPREAVVIAFPGARKPSSHVDEYYAVHCGTPSRIYVAPPPSDPDAFWDVVDCQAACRSDEDHRIITLKNRLKSLSHTEILSFDADFHRCLVRAWTPVMASASSVLNQGFGDVALPGFLSWMIALGSRGFEACLADPREILAHLPRPSVAPAIIEFESLSHVAREIHESRFGMEMPCFDLARFGRFEAMPEADPDLLGDARPALASWVAARERATADRMKARLRALRGTVEPG